MTSEVSPLRVSSPLVGLPDQREHADSRSCELASSRTGSQDLLFLALAYTAGAWLVTGNLKHFPEEVRDGVRVLSPIDYLAHLTDKIA